MLKLVLAAQALALAGAASAQQPATYQSQLLRANQACILASNDAAAPGAVVTACLAAVVDLSKLRAGHAQPTVDDENVYGAMTSLAHAAIGASYGAIDGARSKRSCDAGEAAWAAASRINLAASVSTHADDMKVMRDDARSIAEICRQSFGAPIAAPPLE
jgi:hypothetical protein